MDESASPQNQRQQQPLDADGKFPGDLIVGVIVLVVYGCCTALASLSLMQPPAPTGTLKPGPPVQPMLAVLATFVVLVSGFGITLSKKWGHVLALLGTLTHCVLLILFIIKVPETTLINAKLQNPPPTAEQIGSQKFIGYLMLSFMLLVQVALASFCFRRLTGRLGPPPL